jgi:hypothetical protein
MPVPSRLLLVVVAAAALAAGCGDANRPCPPTAPLPAVVVEIREGGTELPLADAARGVIREGTYVDSLIPWARVDGVLVSRAAGVGRAGTYDVEVSLLGYGLWQQSGVVAPLGACNVETATLQVTLQPASR